MDEFTSRLSCRDLKNRSKTVELLYKNIQTYWQSSYRGRLVVDVNFTQNNFTSFCGRKMGMAHNAVQM